MSAISAFEMLSIGIGPSSSHTLGPWRALLLFEKECVKQGLSLQKLTTINIHLYGSLALTGKGHATDKAVLLGLSGANYESDSEESFRKILAEIYAKKQVLAFKEHIIRFNPEEHIIFHRKALKEHANGIIIEAHFGTTELEVTYFSVGGGFVVNKSDFTSKQEPNYTYIYPSNHGKDLLNHCNLHGKKISDLVLENEIDRYGADYVHKRFSVIWNVMLEAMYTGCHTEGELPGGLRVIRRAAAMNQSLIVDTQYNNAREWLAAIRRSEVKFRQILQWVSAFAIAVNEVNASMGRVVTAPTNGSAGVIPAVLMYYLVIENHDAGSNEIERFLAIAAEVGTLFKKNATLSAAMGGCQAEIGVSSAMAAAALTELMGGTPEQCLSAAEIAMEHHLGLTCDPIAGLVQIPCIERNSMGAIKAINASELALGRKTGETRVSLDQIIETMWDTAKNMSTKYKETSQGGLAIKVNLSDC
ncbi:MAG: L-serine ammonia-lyase [Bacteroidetes bacterium]|nr:L-serine ammonia-lyase [Bacteroidota bacterium]MDA1148836.1 L-serine ammonia-lyase [Bacteroidota bacterium]